MEKIDRELLIKEISSRLPYDIKTQVLGWDEEEGEVEVPLKVYSINTDGYLSFEYNHYSVETVYVEDCRLYLRPMSSMTETEKKEMLTIFEQPCKNPRLEVDEYCGITYTKYAEQKHLIDTYYDSEQQSEWLDWLNAHHFDFRNLIERGLALEAPEGMYNLNTKQS